MRHKAYLFFFGMLLAAPAVAQLNENCVVSILNRNAAVKVDGSWVLPNIPANFGKVRARATCVQNGLTSHGQSGEFIIPTNDSVTLPPILLGPTTPIPSGLRLNVGNATLTGAGTTTQIQVVATYPSGNQVDVTSSGTSYSVSNSAIASITPAGLVTAVSSGTVMVQAINEGAQGITQLRVGLSSIDGDGDGIPDEAELVLGTDPGNPADALLDLDHDGLTALEEYRAGTDVRKPDSDGDGVSDGDEVHCTRGFCSSPVLADTDGDGVRDGTELLIGSDPGNAASVNLGAALRSIRVAPGSFNLIVNSLIGKAGVQLSVIGTMIDGVEVDLTSSARQTRYTSNNLDSCNFGGADGQVYASAAGVCEITISNNGHAAQARGTVQDFAPSALSVISIQGFANGLAISGDFAYVAAGAAGLQVVALGSDRLTPKTLAVLNLGDNANDIFLAGDSAYVATSGGLKVVDISAPDNPRLLGSLGDFGKAMGVKVRGNNAYVVGGDSLHIVNVANPAAMMRMGSIALGGTAWNLELDTTRNLVAVAMGEAGLKLVDIGHLSAPILVGTVLTGDARGVALLGNTAIVADHVNSMTSVDLTNPAAPTIFSSTLPSLGGLLNNVTLSGNFALGADVAFVNGVSIVDISNPQSLQPRAILNFTDRDDNGMNIAADGNYIYLAADRNALERGGVDGDSRLYIGKYQPTLDLAGISPTVTITAPVNGTSRYEGEPVTVTADAQDDISVAAVRFLVNNQTVFSTTSAPYQYTFQVPIGASRLEVGAIARDLGGNETSASPITIDIAPDPLTQAIGQVIGTDGAPLAGAVLTAPGGRTAITGLDGRFQITGIPTITGKLVLQASYVPSGSFTRHGSSDPIPPVRAGVTDMGEITVIDIKYETDYGTFQTLCAICHVRRTLPFIFPYYGVDGTSLTTDGQGTIELKSLSGSSSGYIFTMYGGMVGSGGVMINDRLPGRYVITYERVKHHLYGGSNTVQVQLFHNGRIVIAFNGITALRRYFMTGIAPLPSSSIMSIDYSAKRFIESPTRIGILDYFSTSPPSDLDHGFVVFSPLAAGYSVRTVLPPPSTSAVTLSGAAPTSMPLAALARLRALAKPHGGAPTGTTLANAEVKVTSTGNSQYVGMTNTDARGRFTLKGVPSGSVNVEIWRNGRLLARGSKLSRVSETLHIDLVSPEIEPRN